AAAQGRAVRACAAVSQSRSRHRDFRRLRLNRFGDRQRQHGTDCDEEMLRAQHHGRSTALRFKTKVSKRGSLTTSEPEPADSARTQNEISLSFVSTGMTP